MGQYSTTEILIVALLLWGGAMSAATWARFKHADKQLTTSAPLLLSGGIWLGIFIVLVSGEQYVGNTVSAGVFLVALACYAILKIDNTARSNKPDEGMSTLKQVAPGAFNNGMLLSVSLGVLIFASQFSGTGKADSDLLANLPAAGSEITEGRKAPLKGSLEQPENSFKSSFRSAVTSSALRHIRLEDGWNISLFHYDQGSDTVQIEAVTPRVSGDQTLGQDNTLKAAPNNWHQISNVKVVAYAEDTPATWIEVELSEDDIDTLRFAAETGAISIYSE